MEQVIALGTAACNLASHFESHAQYKVYRINDKGDRQEKNFIKIPTLKNPEDYETVNLNFKRKLTRVEGDVLFVVCGCSKVASASLVVLQYLHKKCNISLLYIKPDISFLSEKERLQERAVYNILQQYARSGVFNNIMLVSNETVEGFLQEVSISEHFNLLNKTVSDAIHMINYFNHVKPVSSTFSDVSEASRIYTIGFFELENNQENMFFSLDETKEKRYYYAINKSTLESEKGLHKKILNQLKEKQIEGVGVSYSIYETSYETNFGFVVEYSSEIQK